MAQHSGYMMVAQHYRAGSVALVAATSVAVVFSSPMPDANYQVFFQPQASLAVGLWASALAASGFTANAASLTSATISYVALGNN